MAKKKTIKIYVYAGIVDNVKGLPRGYNYKVINQD